MTLTPTSATAPTRTVIAHVRAANPSADVLLLCKTLESLLNVLDGTPPPVKPKLKVTPAGAHASITRKRIRRLVSALTVAYPVEKKK